MYASNKLTNPFEGQRWEQDVNNIIYMPEIFSELEKKQDLYLVGSRGTGKTTLLKALNWKIKIENPSLKMQIKDNELFINKYIGIYIDVMSFADSFFEINDYKDEKLMRLYSLWIETNVLYRSIKAIEGLCVSGHIDFSIKDEYSQCNKIYDYLSNQFGSTILKERKNTRIEYNISLLEEVVGELRSKIIDEREYFKTKYESYSFGNLIEKTIPNLLILCDEDDDTKWSTKICFDQVESAPNFQKIVNTLVVKKLSKRIWFIVSGLNHRDIEINNTYIPNHNLTNDDRAYIDLDKTFFEDSGAKNEAFYSLAEGICDLRLKHSDNTIAESKQFNLTSHLGFWNMNQILDVFLKDKEKISVNDKFDEFMKLVKENNKKNKYRTKFPPYIETYYYDILKNEKKWSGTLQKSRQKNRGSGKKYVVITLALLNEYGFQGSTPYVGKRQILSLCNSTRDFLKLMKALFDERMKNNNSKDLNYFFSFEADFTPKEIGIQTKAATTVSEDKFNSIEYKHSKKTTERMRIFIDTCGNILYNLQAKKDLSSLMSDEKGVFTVSFQNNANGEKLRIFLKNADDDTYIKILAENTENGITTIDFELSRLFAPKYKFSFRKTRNKIKINGTILTDLCVLKKESLDSESKKLVESVETTYKTKESVETASKTKNSSRNKSNIQQKLF